MKHLTVEQRYVISALKQLDFSNSKIADMLGVHKSTIGRELKRNSDQRDMCYKFELAQRKYENRKKNKAHYIKLTDEMKDQIISKLIKDRWQPEQISNRLKLEGYDMVSTTTIYRHIHYDRAKGGKLYKFLRRQKPYRKLKGAYKDNRGQIKDKHNISERPDIVEQKKRFGDLEIDTMIGKGRKGALLTINDRKTGLLWIRNLPNRSSEELKEATIEMLKPIVGQIHTITSDNGKEFALHQQIADKLEIMFYFADPYHSSQRGANENANGLIRQFFPKGIDFRNITNEAVEKVQNLLNNRPRKRLNYLTPNEKFEEILFNNKVAFTS